jgi:Protein kinase domain
MHYKLCVTDLAHGSAFAGYRIEELAGRGGMGVVYRATDLDLERTVALKLISAELSDNSGFRRRFEAESKIAASLDHPNVIPLFHAGEHDGLLYLVMRYVEGEDLRDEIAMHGRLSPERAVSITAQIASALDAAHAKGLVHRDVKPANILLALGDHAYLTDFGLTKRLLVDSEETVTENLLGTLDYVAPEQIRGQEVGPRTDIYALGCVLFNALTGKAPFAALEREGKLWAHVSEPPEPLGADFPAALDGVIARALAKEPAERFETAGDLADAAADALADQGQDLTPASHVAAPVSAEPVSRPPVSRHEYGRALLVHALLAPFSLAVAGGTLVAGLLFGVFPIAVPVALLLYGAAAAVVFFDQDVQQRVLERERAKRPGPQLEADGEASRPALADRSPPPRIAALLEQASDKQARIHDAIERAELPYTEVSEEVDRLIATIRQIAAGAELLDEGLQDAPPEKISGRLKELEGEEDPGRKRDLTDALRAQLAVQQRLEQQLDRFYGRMEGILVEFDTIRGQLVSLSASTDAGNQRLLAARVHSLREQAGSVAEGMESAYADHDVPTDTERK